MARKFYFNSLFILDVSRVRAGTSEPSRPESDGFASPPRKRHILSTASSRGSTGDKDSSLHRQRKLLHIDGTSNSMKVTTD